MANRERPPESERRRGRAAPRRTARDFDDRESTSFVPGRDELTQKPARTLAGGGRGIEAPRYAETQALAVGPRRLRLDSHAAPGLSGRTAERYGYPPRPGDLPEREAAPPSFSRTPPYGDDELRAIPSTPRGFERRPRRPDRGDEPGFRRRGDDEMLRAGGWSSTESGRSPDAPHPRRSAYGLGPKDYTRSDERLREEICERLTRDDVVDASEISVEVAGGEVTLAGSVDCRAAKHRAEDIVDSVLGVVDISNRLRVGAADAGDGRSQRSSSGGRADSGSGSKRPSSRRKPKKKS